MAFEEERFVDRLTELEELRRLAARRQPGVAVVYGRRRVGKTFLLSRAWPDQRVFYFLAADVTAELNRRELLRELSDWTKRDLAPADYPTWRTVMRLFGSLAREAPLVLVLDEFQFLCRGEDDIRSQTTAVFDRELAGVPLLIVLSGSAVSMMEEIGRGSLFGRQNWTARIEPFDYWHAAEMTPGRPLRDLALLYGIFGGTPRYLAAIQEGESVEAAAVRAILSPRGEVHVQLRDLIEQEQGIRNPSAYNSVLEALGHGHHRIAEIAAWSKLEPGVVRSVLRALEEELGYVYRERNFQAPATAPFLHRIDDTALAFWQRFVLPNRSRLERGGAGEVWRRSVQPHLDQYMGKVFERICGEAYVRHHQRWDMPGSEPWARWEGLDRNRRPIEIDLVARLDTGALVTGEIKWSSRPCDPRLHADLLRDLEDLSHSGQGWARDGLRPEATYAYFSAAGFTQQFHELAAQDRRIRLYSLEDLY